MSKTVTPDQIQQVKIAAKRLQKSLSGAKLQKCQDITAYQLLGVANFHEAQALAKAYLSCSEAQASANDGITPEYDDSSESASEGIFDDKVSYAEYTGLSPVYSVGDWHYFSENHSLSFDGERLPYVFQLKDITTTGKLLDCILQLSKKRWPRRMVKELNISSHYQVQEFLELMNVLSEAYLGTSLQGAFSPAGKSRVVNWEEAIAQRGERALAVSIAKRTDFVQRFGL